MCNIPADLIVNIFKISAKTQIGFLKIIAIHVKLHWKEWSISRKLTSSRTKAFMFLFSVVCQYTLSDHCDCDVPCKNSPLFTHFEPQKLKNRKNCVNCMLYTNLELKSKVWVRINRFPFLLSVVACKKYMRRNMKYMYLHVLCWFVTPTKKKQTEPNLRLTPPPPPTFGLDWVIICFSLYQTSE